MKRPPTIKLAVWSLKHGNPDQQWFMHHPDRQYRIRPRQLSESGNGLLILKQVRPGCRLVVEVGPEGAMFADSDETLGKVFDILQGRKARVIFTLDGTVDGKYELKS